MKKTFVDFFAGIGLVEIGLTNTGWHHLLSVDYSELKRDVYKLNFGKNHAEFYRCADIFEVDGTEVPESFLAHASFPCTDVSSAGPRKGVQDGNESSAIDSFLRIVSEMADKKPAVLMLENVKGLITSHGGKDLRFLVKHINSLGYAVDLVCIDAKNFVPQSRKRVFLICQNTEYEEVQTATSDSLKDLSECDVRCKSVTAFIKQNCDLNWVVKDLPKLPKLVKKLPDIIDNHENVWWTEERTDYLITQMFDRHSSWLIDNIEMEEFRYATAFRRMRERNGKKQSTAEIRNDGIAGCLRTAKGGSAKQILLRTGKGEIKARLLSPLECARLMGADEFDFNGFSANDAFYCLGDAVCVDVIKWLDNNYLTPLYNNLKNSFKKPVVRRSKDAVKTIDFNEKLRNEIWYRWCQDHKHNGFELPIKGRLYGSLIVLSSVINEDWSFEELNETKSTDRGNIFTDRSIRGHTSHRIKKILSAKGQSHLASGHGEQGRTSTGTKRAGLDLIRGLVELVNGCPEPERSEQLIWHAEQLLSLSIELLQSHYDFGGIDLTLKDDETISSFIGSLVEYPTNNSVAICQHLVGAKLALRYSENKDVCITHNNSNTAALQCGREGDFELHDTVFHVTKAPTKEHRAKALEGAKKGKKVVFLVPKNLVLSQASNAKLEELGTDFEKKVDVFSIEQFISQNIEELAIFDKARAKSKVRELISTYNELVNKYENDKSILIQSYEIE
ncbi:DNA-cytosine methyltransferase [Glaciecola sp. 4H-3-7+YE-5]|nr:DNA-cytosine methyltransferase [Glaciecola sp. 4H-3-7+YE-5]